MLVGLLTDCPETTICTVLEYSNAVNEIHQLFFFFGVCSCCQAHGVTSRAAMHLRTTPRGGRGGGGK